VVVPVLGFDGLLGGLLGEELVVPLAGLDDVVVQLPGFLRSQHLVRSGYVVHPVSHLRKGSSSHEPHVVAVLSPASQQMFGCAEPLAQVIKLDAVVSACAADVATGPSVSPVLPSETCPLQAAAT